MNRERMLGRLEADREPWDVIIVGGGATGLGCAIDAAARGYRTLLLERDDLAKGTSSRSTKLVHGGVRYLQQGNLSLVLGALRERGLLRQNAPHLVHAMPFVVPCYKRWARAYYAIGLTIYDMLARRLRFGRSRLLSKRQALDALPTLEPDRLRGGVMYFDGQFDDARLAIAMARTAVEQGATLLNYVEVTGLMRRGGEEGKITGVIAEDRESGQRYELHAKAVINATGVFTDSIRRMESPGVEPMIRPSQGAHLVLDRSFLPGDAALMVPRTDDGRVLFAIPWHGRVIVGTTDTPTENITDEPRALRQEIEFLLTHAARYLAKDPTAEDVRSVFVGLRPLVARARPGQRTSVISRDHTIDVSPAGLITIAGGKWTTYRKMAEDTIDQAASLAGLDTKACPTRTLHLHGHQPDVDRGDEFAHYGSDAPALRDLLASDPRYAEKLHPSLPYHVGEIVWAARHEMARTVEDALARRTRALLLDARAAMEAAPRVAELLAEELGRDDEWQARQVEAFNAIANSYTLS